MKKLKLLWIDNDENFGPSIQLRVAEDTAKLGYHFEEPETLIDGQYVWETVRDWKPDIIMMDHNLEDVKINGANLIIEIRFHNQDTPIIFYSSGMDERLLGLVENENAVYPSTRDDVGAELISLLRSM